MSIEKLDEIVSGITYSDADFTPENWREVAKDVICRAHDDHNQSIAENRADPCATEEEQAQAPLSLDDFLDQPGTQKLVDSLQKGPDGIGYPLHENELIEREYAALEKSMADHECPDPDPGFEDKPWNRPAHDVREASAKTPDHER